MAINVSFRNVGRCFKEAIQLILVNKKLVVYAAFFALAGGVFNLVKSIPSYAKYLEFYNPFWTSFDWETVLSFKSWLSALGGALGNVLTFKSLVGDIAYLSSANLISVGVLVAALFFSIPLKEFFRKNDFAWQAAFYSFGSSMLFLPLFLLFSRVFKIYFLAAIFMVAESLALSVFLAVLLTFFEGIFLYSIKFRLGKKAHTRAEIFAAADGVFRPLFIFNLIWMFLNPINFSILFLLIPVAPDFLNISAKIMSLAFLLFSVAFVFVPVLLIFKPFLTALQAMKNSLLIFKTRTIEAFIFLFFGVLLQVVASFLINFLARAIVMFGGGVFIEHFFRSVVGPFFYSFILLVFVAAMIKFLVDFLGKEPAPSQGQALEIGISSRFLPQAQSQGAPLEKRLGEN